MGGLGISKRQGRLTFLIKSVPSLHFTRSPPIHLILVMHHLSDTRKRNTAFMFHSSSLSSTRFCWFFLCLPCLSCVIRYSCLKRSYSFLFQCVSQSVCLSLSIRPSSWLSGCRWKSEVMQWATSSGGLLRGEALPLIPRGPNRRGLVLLSLSSHSLSLFAINVFSRFPSPKDVMCKVGEVFLSLLFCVLFPV